MCVCTNMMSFIVLALFEAVSLYFLRTGQERFGNMTRVSSPP